MKNKGFTLVELMAVIIILGVISAIALPIISGVMTKTKTDAYNRQIDLIVSTAKNWAATNSIKLSDINGGKYTLTLDELEASSFLPSSDVVNPIDDSKIDGCVIITYVAANDNYDFLYSDVCNIEN